VDVSVWRTAAAVTALLLVGSVLPAGDVAAAAAATPSIAAFPDGDVIPAQSSSATASPPQASTQHELPGVVLVRFRDASAVANTSVLQTVNGLEQETVGTTGYVRVAIPGSVDDAVTRLGDNPAVLGIEPDYIRSASASPNDPLFRKGGPQSYLSTMRVPQAWDVTTGSAAVTLAVVDSGVDPSHPDLAGRVLPGKDFVNNDSDAADDNGHGTAVAGVAAAATNNGLGIAGVTWTTKVLPVKVLDSSGAGSDSAIASGITWAADNGASIINLSLGAGYDGAVLRSAVQYALAKGVVVVAAAGNNADAGPVYPAAYPGVLAVSATDESGTFASFSNIGSYVGVAAPGVNVMAPVSTAASVIPITRDRYTPMSGTSFSAALVSGVASLVKAQHPDWSPAQIVDRVETTARDVGPYGVDPYYGHGLVDAAAAVGAAPVQPPAGAPRDALEPNDVADRATVLADNAPVDATIAPEGDVDWYAFDAVAPDTVRINVRSNVIDTPGATHRFLPGISAYGTTFEALGTSQERLSPDTISLNVPITVSGRYRFSVRNLRLGTTARPYTVEVSSLHQSWPNPFFPPEVDAVPARAGAPAVVDATGDGRADVVAAAPNGVWVLPQLPDGTLGPPRERSTSDPQSSLVKVADVNGDGRTDVLAETTAGIVLYAGSPTGLSSATAIPGTAGSTSFVVADFNNDRRPDLLVANPSSGLAVFRNIGTSFAAPVTVSAGSSDRLAVGDINGDGHADVVIGGSGGFNVILQQADGSFAPPFVVDLHTFALGGIAVGDVTGDGRADVVVDRSVNTNTGTADQQPQLLVLAQRSDGTLATPVAYATLDVPDPIVIADINGDGRNDVVVTHRGWEAVGLFVQRTDGTLAPEQLAAVPYNSDTVAAVGDVNTDGKSDLVLSDGDAVVVLRQMSAASPPEPWIRSTTPAAQSSLVATSTPVSATFTRALDPATVGAATVTLLNATTGTTVPSTVSYDGANGVITIRPTNALTSGTAYAAVVDGVKDTTGTSMPAPAEWRFLTTGTSTDTTPPDTVILDAPTTYAAPGAALSFMATEPGSRLECQLNGSVWFPCDQVGIRYSTSGPVSLLVRAIDSAGNVDPTPAAAGWNHVPAAQPPPNCGWSTAPAVVVPSTVTATTTVSSGYGGAASHVIRVPNILGCSLWYTWTASADQTVQLDTADSDFDTVLAVYTGDPASPTEVAWNDDHDGLRTAKLAFSARRGTTYRFVLDGWLSPTNMAMGSAVLHLSTSIPTTTTSPPVPPPPSPPPPTTTGPTTTTSTTRPPSTTTTTPPKPLAQSAAPPAPPAGYRMLDADGTVFAFGASLVYGDAVPWIAPRVPSARGVALSTTADDAGYWIVDDRGGVYSFGTAAFYGGLAEGTLRPDEAVTGLSATPTGRGYWIFTNRGRVFTFGDAAFLGDLTGVVLNGPILGAAPTPTGHGYYMVGSDGGIFAFGDATFFGSMGSAKLNQPVEAIAPTPTGNGYWLVATDGGIFAFGDATFHGSMGGQRLNRPVIGMVPFGNGYLLVGDDGGIFDFSDQPFVGSLGDRVLSLPITAVSTSPARIG
jgi:type VII secretion-associated serine protease mycosin